MLQTSTKLDILNECLAHTGGPPMADSENYKNITERWALNRYAMAVEQVLELRPWSGAIKEIKINKLNSDIASGLNEYQCPADMARPNFIRNLCDQDWDRNGSKIVTANTAGYLILAYNSTNTKSTWGAHLRSLMGLVLAMKISYAIETSAAKKRTLEELYARNVLIASGSEGASHSAHVWRTPG